MRWLKAVGEFLTDHWIEIILAIIFAILFELIGIRARYKLWVRRLGNRLSEISVSRMQKRIRTLERKRKIINWYLESEQTATRRLVSDAMLVLLYLSVGCLSSLGIFIWNIRSPTTLFPEGWFLVGFAVWGFGGAIASAFGTFGEIWDWPSDLESRASTLTQEIADLERKVKARV
jgi:hypothetical protein